MDKAAEKNHQVLNTSLLVQYFSKNSFQILHNRDLLCKSYRSMNFRRIISVCYMLNQVGIPVENITSYLTIQPQITAMTTTAEV